jgi:hypothetical protein
VARAVVNAMGVDNRRRHCDHVDLNHHPLHGRLGGRRLASLGGVGWQVGVGKAAKDKGDD